VSDSCARDQQRELENAVVVYLVTRTGDVEWLVQRAMARVYKYFLERWQYPVVVFVPSERMRKWDPQSYFESPSKSEMERHLRHVGMPEGVKITVEEFDLELPKGLPKNWREQMNGCASRVSTAYKHMNQFFTKGLYEHPALNKYRYYMRLDADIMFTKNMAHDPFCMIKETGRKFMYEIRHHVGDKTCSEGMLDWFQQYANNNSIMYADGKIWNHRPDEGTYIGYIGVGDLNWFRSEKVMKLARAFNDDGRVYLNRWSDQTYYVLLLALFEPHSAVGDIGINWPYDSFCHKCKPNAARVSELIGETSSHLLPHPENGAPHWRDESE